MLHLPHPVDLQFNDPNHHEGMTRVGYSLFVVRKALQGVVGYLSHIAPTPPLTPPTRLMLNALSVLTHLQLSLYGSYTCLFSALSAWRLRNIWMDRGKYALDPKPFDKKVMTTIFHAAQITTDMAAFIATLLIATDLLKMSSAWSILIYSMNSAVNLVKFGVKLGRTLANRPAATSSAEQINQFRYKRTHYSIRFGLGALATLSLIPFFTLSAPYHLITYLSLISLCSLSQIAYRFYGKTRLQEQVFGKALDANQEDIELTVLTQTR